MAIEVLEECCFVLPPVKLFQQEQAKEDVHIIACRTPVAVVGSESEIGHRKIANELVNRIVGLVSEPPFGNRANV